MARIIISSDAGVKTRKDRRLREEIVHTTLRCGLPAYVVPKPGYRRKIAIAATRYGSIDLRFQTRGSADLLDTPAGIAHFLEHQLFKKEGGKDVLAEFGKYGASSNAYTDYNSTTYYFSTSEGFEPSLDMLLSLTFAPYFHPDYVAKEKLIIEQELKMYEDMPDYRAYRALMAALYREHPVRQDVGGTVQSIQEIDAGLLESCYRVFYHPTNMVFVAAGDLDPEAVFDQLDRALPPEKFVGDRVTGRNLPEEPAGVKEKSVEAKMLVSRPRVLVGLKDLGNGSLLDREVATTAMLHLILGRGGKFYTRAYESGLIDDSFSFGYTAEPEFNFSVIGGETDDPEALVRAVCRELKSAVSSRFKKRDVERTKRKMIGRYLRSFDTPDSAAFLVTRAVMSGVDVFEIPKAIGRLSPQLLLRRLRDHFRPENLAVSTIRPK